MTDALARIERLAAKKQDQRRADWEAIKQADETLADWLMDISKGFGKPPAMQIRLVSGLVVDNGRAVIESPAWDGRLRPAGFRR